MSYWQPNKRTCHISCLSLNQKNATCANSRIFARWSVGLCLPDFLHSQGTRLNIFLQEHGYTSNPDRLISPFPVDYISETNGVAYLDVNADAVRKGGCGSRPAGSRKFLHSV
jgi:hypothetical protein